LSKIALSGDPSGTGTFTIASPNSNSNYTLTLPANTGTLLTTASTFAGTGPSFGASQNAAQTINRGTFTKLTFNVEDWDTASCYDPTTNYRFTPNVAGYYNVCARTQFTNDTASRSETFIAIYKNGSVYKRTPAFGAPANVLSSPGGSLVVYLNGSTDYVEAYVYYGDGSASNALNATTDLNYFQAFLARAA